jgi:hypothetical protein
LPWCQRWWQSHETEGCSNGWLRRPSEQTITDVAGLCRPKRNGLLRDRVRETRSVHAWRGRERSGSS